MEKIYYFTKLLFNIVGKQIYLRLKKNLKKEKFFSRIHEYNASMRLLSSFITLLIFLNYNEV